MYELKKNRKVFTSISVGTGTSAYEKRNLPGRGVTKVEKHRSTVSGINETINATYCSNPVTLTTGSSNGLNNARYFRYSVMNS